MRFDYVAQAMLVLIGVIHLYPGLVALAPSRAAAMYGTGGGSRDLELLLRHRALLLALVGAVTIVGAFFAPLRVAAITVVAISMTSFLVLALVVGLRQLGRRTKRVAQVDAYALVALAIAIVAFTV